MIAVGLEVGLGLGSDWGQGRIGDRVEAFDSIRSSQIEESLSAMGVVLAMGRVILGLRLQMGTPLAILRVGVRSWVV